MSSIGIHANVLYEKKSCLLTWKSCNYPKLRITFSFFHILSTCAQENNTWLEISSHELPRGQNQTYPYIQIPIF